MKVTLPEKVTGARDALFVLEVEFPVASAERMVEVGVTGPIEPLDLSGSTRGGSYRVPVGLERLHVPMRVLQDGDAASTVTVRCTEGPESGQSEERSLRLEADAVVGGGRRGRWLGAVAAVVVVVLGAWGVSQVLGKDKVPDLTGLTQEQAEEKLEQEGIAFKPIYEWTSKADEVGIVIRTVPPPGSDVPGDRPVEVILGKLDDTLVPIPPVVGDRGEDAEAALRAAGYRPLVTVVPAEDPSLAGRVIRQSPDGGTPLARGRQVEIFVGGEPDFVEMPALDGLAQDEAIAALRNLDLGWNLEEEPAADAALDGRVLRHRPAAGERLAPGATVTLFVARAGMPPPVEPPPVEPPPVEPPPVEPPPVEPPPVEPPPVEPPPVEPPPVEPPPVEPPPVEPPPVEPTALVPDAEGRFLIPDMRGWDRQRAMRLLSDAGLVPVVTLEPPPSAEQSGKVIRQRPAGGERRGPASMIFLIVGEGAVAPPVEPPPVEPPPVEPPPVEPPPVEPPPVEPPPVEPPPVEPPPVEPPPVEPPPVEPPPVAPPVEPLPPIAPPSAGEPRPVPDVVGELREKAEGLVRQAGFLYRIVLKVTDYPADGTVLGQDPAPGTSLAAGAEVVLEVAQAPPDAKIPVPSVVGTDRAVAERMLREAGFLVNVTLGGGAPNEQGLVLDQAPRGETSAPRRSWVEIVVASGSGPRRTARGGPPSIGPTRAPPQPAPGTSSGLEGPPAVGTGPVRVPPGTPRGPSPVPPVELPPRGSAPTARVPATTGSDVRQAIVGVLGAGLLPILEVDRTAAAPAERIVRQTPEGGAGALPGDLVRLTVAMGGGGSPPFVDLPMAIGAELGYATRVFTQSGLALDVVEVQVPNHPYAGTGRVAAQYPVGRHPRARVQRVTVWVVRR